MLMQGYILCISNIPPFEIIVFSPAACKDAAGGVKRWKIPQKNSLVFKPKKLQCKLPFLISGSGYPVSFAGYPVSRISGQKNFKWYILSSKARSPQNITNFFSKTVKIIEKCQPVVFIVTPFNYSAGYRISGKTDWPDIRRPDIRPIQYPLQPL